MTPIVSVCMLTYNQETLVRKALEGAVRQQSDFSFEIVVGEDFSTDGTRAVCEEFANRHPDLVRLLPDEGRNLGLKENFLRTYHACKGKYIAYLEGDDHWTDPLKLQKQAAILDGESDVVLVHTNCKLWNVATGEINDRLIQFEGTCVREQRSGIAGVECEFTGHFRHVKTSTCMFRKAVMDSILAEDLQAYSRPDFLAFDVQLFLDMAYRGRFGFIDEETTVIGLGDTLSVSSDPQRALDYRISFHKIGRYYIGKYHLRPEVQRPWLEREAHWFLNFGMQHPQLATQVAAWADEERTAGYRPSKRQRTLLYLLTHPAIRNVLLPVYSIYHASKEGKR